VDDQEQIEKDLLSIEIEDKIILKLIPATQSASKFVRSYHFFSEREEEEFLSVFLWCEKLVGSKSSNDVDGSQKWESDSGH
jgi:hypothetical protein